MVQSPSPQTRAIKRTLCIGLGGTGRDVLMRIRRLIIERHGKLSNLPVISFLQIDTDKDAFNSSGLPSGNNYRGEPLLFNDAEKVFVNMTAQDVDNLLHELEHKSLFESPYSHIEEWLDPQLKDKIKAIEDGAHGIRPVGRLAFFHNFRKIQSAIETAENRTRGYEAFLLKQGFNVETGLDIFVIGSLCGGTGSGIFIDIGYTLRNLYKNNTQIYSYLIISPKLFGDTRIMNANVYGALKELNYYNTEGTTFTACYDKQNRVNVTEKRPPFDYSYLISDTTLGDYKIIQKGKLCNVIAYKIYLEIASEIGSKMQAQRNNFLDPMLKPDEHPFKLSQRYLTFGISAIYFTRDRLVQIALNRLTIKLLQFWSEGHGQSPDAQDLVNRFLSKWNADKDERDCFSQKLADLTQEDNKTFSQSIERWRKSLQDIELKNNDDLEQYCQSLPTAFRREFRKVQPGATESTRGTWLTLLQNSQQRVNDLFKQDIDQFLNDLLNPDNQDFSIYNALAYLEALKTKINYYQKLIEEKKQTMKGMHTSEKIEKVWTNTQQEIEDMRKQSKLPFFNSNKRWVKIQDVMVSSVQEVAKLLQHNFEVPLLMDSLKITEELQSHVAVRLNQIQNFNHLIVDLLNDYDRQEVELRQLNLDEMSGEAIFPQEEIDQFVPNNTSRTQLTNISCQITDALGMNPSLLGLIYSTVMNEKVIQDNINLTVEKLFSSLSWAEMQSVIKRFMASYPVSDRARRLTQILQLAQPLLDLNLSSPRYHNGNEKSNQFICFKQSDDLEIKIFQGVLVNELVIANDSFQALQNENEILFINEYAGFPLRIINSLQQMKDYFTLLKNEDAILHNHFKIIFGDIIPTDAKLIEQLEYLLYPCLAFDLLTLSPNSQYYEFPCYDSLRKIHYTANISIYWQEALEQLASRQDMVDILSQLLNHAENDVKKNPHLMQADYFLRVQKFVGKVDQLPEEHRNFIHKAKVIGERATVSTIAKEGIITRYIKKLEDEIKAGENDKTGNVSTIPLPKNDVPLLTSLENNNLDGMSIVQASDNPILAELERLANLKNQGFLTEEEFQKAKAKLLN